MTYKLRPYQSDAVGAVLEAWHDQGMRAPAVVLPTGAGKTVVFSHIAREVLRSGGRPLILAHRTELIDQSIAKLKLAGLPSVGKVQGATRQTWGGALVASVQSLNTEAKIRALGDVTHTIVDECHHATAASYTRVFDVLGGQRVGFTATMLRSDGAALGTVWDRVVYERDILYMIRRGHLTDVAARRVVVDDFRLDRVSKSRGDYSETGLGRALEDSAAPETIAQAIVEHARGRSTVVFTPTVSSSQAVEAACRAAGLTVAHVDGAMPAGRRRAVLADHVAGRVQVLCNCMVLTEGWDNPRAKVAVIARPTSSAGLYVQMVGRVLRPYPGEDRALVIDVVGTAAGRLPLADLTTLAGLDPREVAREKDDEVALLDLVEERAGAELAAREELERTELSWEEVTLFGESHSLWLKTPGGMWFVPAGDRFVALRGDDEAGWGVAYGNTERTANGRRDRGWIDRGPHTIEDAMGVAETWLAGYEAVFTEKDRAWRKRKASAKALAFARRLGADVEDGMRAGEVGDMISIRLVAAAAGERV